MAHRTPLRYPGGKQRLTSFILELMAANGLVGGEYAEPFAGGSGIAMELLLGGHVEKIHLNDSCKAIHAFWRSILDQPDEFCRRVREKPLTVAQWKKQREVLRRPDEFDTLDIGFSTFFLNRCNRSGIVAGGGIIGGLEQTGKWKMDARFPRKVLVARIEAIAAKRDVIAVTNLDAEDFIAHRVPELPVKSLIYFDPPYYNKSDRLYFDHYKQEDHVRIATAIQDIQRPWMVSYDNAQVILDCYSKRRQFTYRLQYNAAEARKGREVFFFSDGLTVPTKSALPFINRALHRLSTPKVPVQKRGARGAVNWSGSMPC